MSVSYKCPNCAANLEFDADTQQMSCKFCGSLIRPEDVITVQNPEWKQETAEKWQSDVVTYTCGNCGAAVITDQNTSATFCAFCGSPAIVPERLVEGYAPSEVIPFAYGRDAAVNKFFEWCRKGLMTPNDFASDKNIEKLTGIYVPFWLFDNEVDMLYTAKGTKVHSVTSGNTTTTTTEHYYIQRNRKEAWDRIPLDGATHMDDKLMEIIEPYDYRDLTKFDMKYLAGFYAEKYDLPEDKLHMRLKERLVKYVKCIFDTSVKGYTSVSDVADKSTYYRPRYAYALLPVWMLNYQYRGKKYTFAMNGQTGKVAGEPPVSRMKLLVVAAASLLVTGIIFYFVGGAFL